MHTNYRPLFEPLITDEDRKKDNDIRNLKVLIGIVMVLLFVVI